MTDTSTSAEQPAEDSMDDDVAKAEQEAAEAEQLIATLERKVEDGDETITPEQITAQVGLSRFAKLRLAAVRKKADAARERRNRQARLAIHDEVDAYESTIGQRLAHRLRAVAAAEAEFTALAEEHNAKVNDWRNRAMALGEEKTLSPARSTARGHLNVSGLGIELVVGTRKLSAVNARNLLDRHRERAFSSDDRERLYEHLQRESAEQL